MALEMVVVDNGSIISPMSLSTDRRAGYKTRMNVRGEKKRNILTKKHLGKVTSYSLQQDLAYFHRSLKLDEEHLRSTQSTTQSYEGFRAVLVKNKDKKNPAPHYRE